MSNYNIGETILHDAGGNFIRATEDGFLNAQGLGYVVMDEIYHNTFDAVNRWNETKEGSVTRSVVGQILALSVTTSAGDSIKEAFRQTLLPTAGALCELCFGQNLGPIEQENNVKEWGILNNTGDEGIFFRLNGSLLGIVTVRGGAETITDITSSKPPAADEAHLYKIVNFVNLQYWIYIDNVLVLTKLTTTPYMNNKDMRPYMRHYNTGALSGAVSAFKNCGMHVVDRIGGTKTIAGTTDDNLVKDVAVSTSGRLLVEQAPPFPPPDTYHVNIGGKVYPGKNAGYIDTAYTITSGRILTIQSWSGGGQGNAGDGGECEIYYDPDGDMGVNAILITSPAYFLIGDFQRSMYDRYSGNGTTRIVLRATNYTPSDGLEFAQFFSGYEEDL